VIHGKAEHEETRTTFSNATKAAPAVIIRNLKEAEALIAVINEEDPAEKEILFQPFRSNASQGFDVHKDLDRIAVVNQTTLLRNETLEIISRLEENFASKYGKENVVEHISKQQDTLCYATQVNQDALTHALGRGINFAIIVGGKNSSNTYQLFRICEDKLGERVAYIQSEEDIISLEEIMHYIFISQPGNPEQGKLVKRNFLTPRDEPFNILVTGGASCPDGLIQQVISRINSFYPDTCLRSIDEVLKDFED
jgi:4-hydroxy-3-methylbut-2-enyl diphosphate reductase